MEISTTEPELVKLGKSNGPLSKFGKEFHIIFHCDIFTFYHTWYDFPYLHILPLMVLSFGPH